jgi:hypothetical protein
MKILRLISFFILSVTIMKGQKQDSLSKQLGGKWSACTSMVILDDKSCQNSYTSYVFNNNGTYRENREIVISGNKQPYVSGKWKIEGNIFTIDEDDKRNYKAEPFVNPMIWVNRNRFYIYGTEGPGGPIVYTYFDRVE